MKKNSKGFTLIELLAVIVILAIIALIATPIVLGLISRARKGAATDAAYGVRKEAQLIYSTALMEHPTAFKQITVDFSKSMNKDGGAVADGDKSYPETVYFKDDADTTGSKTTVLFELDGTSPSAGKIAINGTGTITYTGIIINNYKCVIPESGEVTCFDDDTKATEAGWTAAA